MLESFVFFLLTFWALIGNRIQLFKAIRDPTILFCLLFVNIWAENDTELDLADRLVNFFT